MGPNDFWAEKSLQYHQGYYYNQTWRAVPYVPFIRGWSTAGDNFHNAGSKRKGERNWASKPSGTPDQFKRLRHGKKEGWVRYKDQNGKKVDRPGTAEELAYLNTRGPSAYSIIGQFIPTPIALGMCLLAPSTCGVIDSDGNGVIDQDELF